MHARTIALGLANRFDAMIVWLPAVLVPALPSSDRGVSAV